MSTATTPPRPAASRLVRWAFACAGVICVALGAIGAVMPGLPTTVFLLVATWFFTRSCPWLERKLVRNRFFSPFIAYLDRSAPMPPRAKAVAVAMLWVFAGLASIHFAGRDDAMAQLAAPVASAGLIGTVAILRWDARVRRVP